MKIYKLLFGILILFFFSVESHSQTNKIKIKHILKYGKYHRNRMDIAIPVISYDKKVPIVVLIHGGAWVMGNKGYFYHTMRYFAKRGIAAATINYRFASDRKKVHQNEILEDVSSAIKYIESNSEKWKIDTIVSPIVRTIVS